MSKNWSAPRTQRQKSGLSEAERTGIEKQLRAGEVAQWVEALSVKLEDPSSKPRTRTVEGESLLQQVVP